MKSKEGGTTAGAAALVAVRSSKEGGATAVDTAVNFGCENDGRDAGAGDGLGAGAGDGRGAGAGAGLGAGAGAGAGAGDGGAGFNLTSREFSLLMFTCIIIVGEVAILADEAFEDR